MTERFGPWGTLLRVDLTNRTTSLETIGTFDEANVGGFWGGLAEHARA